jgi:DNA polymerase-1
MLLVLDFETVDPHLDTLGSGWAHGDMDVIGASLRFETWTEAKWSDKKEDIIWAVNKASTIICHNLQYDVGILLLWGVDIADKMLIDTMILAKLNDASLRSYGLDFLGEKYLKSNKYKDALGEIVLNHGLYKEKGKHKKTKDMGKLNRYGITHMRELYDVEPSNVIKYANQDVDLTWELYKYLAPRVAPKWFGTVSRLYQILLKNRKKGVRIDVDRVREVRDILLKEEKEYLAKLRGAAGDEEFNPLSGPQVSELLYKYNIPYPLTEKGNPSIKSKWLDIQTSPICSMIKEYRRYNKLRRDFCDSVLAAQDLLPEDKKGRVYPEFRIFGACTGRFSCAKPNIQQIPKRDKEIGPLIRSMYIADEGETWYSLDFSQQEYRLFAHFADIVEGQSDIADAFREDPNKDFHDFVAQLCHIERDQAKPINLGSLYGMGVDKMAAELGVGLEEAKRLVNQYHGNFKDVRRLSQACSKVLKKDKYISTILGRKLPLDPPTYVDELVGHKEQIVTKKDGTTRKQKVPIYEKKLVTFEYKGLNKLIQGSAADQVMKVMIEVDKLGIPMLFSVHDEINLSLKNPDDAVRVKEVMENSLNLRVPMVTDIGKGNNWDDAK